MVNSDDVSYQRAFEEGALFGQAVFWSGFAAVLSLAMLGAMAYYRFIDPDQTSFSTMQWSTAIALAITMVTINLVTTAMWRLSNGRTRKTS